MKIIYKWFNWISQIRERIKKNYNGKKKFLHEPKLKNKKYCKISFLDYHHSKQMF